MNTPFKVIKWTPNSTWLVAVTGKDGSYTPVMELHKDGDGNEPTRNNQLYKAAALLESQGMDALTNPHAMIGRTCGCGSCFCCAALEVLTKAKSALKGGK